MSNEAFLCEILQPDKVLFSEKVDMAVLPASDGQIGVLTHHAPLLTSLDAGDITLYNGKQISQTFSIRKGFAEMRADNTLTILVQPAIA